MIIALIIFNQNAIIVYSDFYLQSYNFFERHHLQEFCTFIARSYAKNHLNESNEILQHDQFSVQIMLYRGLIATCITSESHSSNNIRLFLNEALSLFTRDYEQNLYNKVDRDQCFELVELKTLVNKHQKVEQIYETMDETKEILVKNIEDLIDRGTNLDELIEKSDDLSYSSKMFAKKARGMNCCQIF